MRVIVLVNTNSKIQFIKKEKDFFKINLLSKPIKGRANKELITLLENYFHKKVIKIIGKTSRKKMVVFE